MSEQNANVEREAEGIFSGGVTASYSQDEVTPGGAVDTAGEVPETPEPAEPAGESEEELRIQIAERDEELARARADLYNLEQEYNGFVRRARSDAAAQREAGAADLVEALFGVLDEIELARQHGDLTGPFQAIAEKLEAVLAARYSVQRFGKAGEDFDPERHEALMAHEDDEVTSEVIGEVVQPGYTFAERVLRPARVAVKKPKN